MKDCSPWEGLTLEKFVEDCLLWEGPHGGAGEECEEEGSAETMCDELTATPFPRPPAPLAGKRERKLGVELSWGRRERWGKGVLRFGFTSHYPCLDLIGSKLN